MSNTNVTTEILCPYGCFYIKSLVEGSDGKLRVSEGAGYTNDSYVISVPEAIWDEIMYITRIPSICGFPISNYRPEHLNLWQCANPAILFIGFCLLLFSSPLIFEDASKHLQIFGLSIVAPCMWLITFVFLSQFSYVAQMMNNQIIIVHILEKNDLFDNRIHKNDEPYSWVVRSNKE